MFRRNFIRQAVCELRFPTLLELEGKAPTELQARLRKEFPYYEDVRSVRVGPGSQETQLRHIFRSKDKQWAVAFHASAISIETQAYSDFPSFHGRLRRVLDAAIGVIDSDFFTRVGLRYVNFIPSGSKRTELGEWLNPLLLGPLLSGTYGRVAHFWNEVRGDCAGGEYALRHGFQSGESTAEYVLDFDFFAEGVAYESVLELTHSFNLQCFDFFYWCCGPRTLDALGPRGT